MRIPIVLLTVLGFALAGCALTREPSRTPRTAVEQLLLSEALSRTTDDLVLPLPSGSTVVMDVIGFSSDRAVAAGVSDPNTPPNAPAKTFVVQAPSSDLAFVRDMLAGRLGERGLLIRGPGDEATYRVRVVVFGFGTEQGESLVGLPSGSGGVFGIPIPELPIFKKQVQHGYIRYAIDVFETKTGRLVRSTPWYRGSAYYHTYILLFFLTFVRTDLPFPPQ